MHQWVKSLPHSKNPLANSDRWSQSSQVVVISKLLEANLRRMQEGRFKTAIKLPVKMASAGKRPICRLNSDSQLENTKLLARCLDSIKLDPNYDQLEIIVVDNNSGDESVDMVKSDYPHVRLIANTTNAGFSKGCNQAIEIAKWPSRALAQSRRCRGGRCHQHYDQIS